MRQRAYVEILSTWEVWRALKRLELPLAAPLLRKPRKIGNTYRILVKRAFFDAESIVVFIKAKTSKNQRLVARK